MPRTRLLLICVLLVFATSAGLRILSHVHQMRTETAEPTPPPTRPVALPEPWDYVAHPLVALEEIDRGPARIISMAPSITEIVCALGMRDRLVARTPYSQHVPGLEDVPVVGAIDDTNYAKIQSLEPDLVLVTSRSRSDREHTVEGLRRLDLRVESVPHDSLEEIYEAIHRIGELCERPRTAEALVRGIRADLEMLASTPAARPSAPLNVLIVTADLPVPPAAMWVAGPNSFLDSLLEMTGHTNAVAGVLDRSYGQLPLETLFNLDVDVVITYGTGPTDAERADLYRTWSRACTWPAIRERRVTCAGGGEWLSAGPRVAIGLQRLLTVLSRSR